MPPSLLGWNGTIERRAHREPLYEMVPVDMDFAQLLRREASICREPEVRKML